LREAKMKRVVVILAVYCCILAQAVSAQDIKQRLGGTLDKLAGNGFSGSVLVARNNKILLEKGFGLADKIVTRKVNLDTPFYIASISKQFTASAILRLEEQGKLSTSDTIGKYLSGVPEDKKEITIHQVLTHTSGLPHAYAADGIASRDEALKALLKSPLKTRPGEQFGYSNDGYNILAIIVEVVSGESFESFLRGQLLRPAGLSRTGFWGEPTGTNGPIAAMIKPKEVKPNWGFRGATGIYSTVGDLYKWQKALFAKQVLTRASTEKLLTPYVTMPRGKAGYGWFISETEKTGREVWTTGTEDFGHNAMIKTYADGTVVFVLSNAGRIGDILARDLAIREIENVLFTPAK
jgi:CubicO group peptidase (beta-lactamase class C family)